MTTGASATGCPRLTGDVPRYLRTGVDAGMVVPDAVDTEVGGVRVLREE